MPSLNKRVRSRLDSALVNDAISGVELWIYVNGKTKQFAVYVCAPTTSQKPQTWETIWADLDQKTQTKLLSRIQRVIDTTHAKFENSLDFAALKQNSRYYSAWVKQCNGGTCRLYVKECGAESKMSWTQICDNTWLPSCAQKVKSYVSKNYSRVKNVDFMYVRADDQSFDLATLEPTIVMNLQDLIYGLQLADADAAGITQNIMDFLKYDDIKNLAATANRNTAGVVVDPVDARVRLSKINRDFVSEWNVLQDKSTLTLPLLETGTYNFEIDWGDGTKETVTRPACTHYYEKAGVYVVRINGVFIGFSFRQWVLDIFGDGPADGPIGDPYAEYFGKVPLLRIINWGCLKLGNSGGYFCHCKSLVSIDTVPDLSNVRNLDYMFMGAVQFNQNINNWNVSSAVSMRGMFMNATSFNSPLNQWDVQRVKDMSYMFSGCTVFNGLIEDWDVSRVRFMDGMFQRARSFNRPIEKWPVGSLLSARSMFQNASAFDQPIGTWNMFSVENLASMFKGASAFNQPLEYWDVSGVEDMNSMFAYAESFNQDISRWNTCHVTDMSSMFRGALSFNQPLAGWCTGWVTNMSNMFNGATSFDQPVHDWDISSLTSAAYMFWNATRFDSSNLRRHWDLSEINDSDVMFRSST